MHTDNFFVKFDNIQKSYDGEKLVVKNLNLGVKKGEFVTMLGPSGSGKTTCLMMLAGFETATRGEIYLNGRSINNIAPHKRNIGMVFQNYALFPHMTVQENLAYPLRVRKMSKPDIRQKIKNALHMVELDGFGNRHPNMLSGGQKQRIAVARALVFEPELVLMDEPLGALDKQLREQMQYEIKRIHQQLGVTVVYVTHDQSEALTMSDRVAVFDNGIIQQLASPSDLYEHPQNAFVAQFIGENNRFVGHIEKMTAKYRTVRLPSGDKIQALNVTDHKLGDMTSLSLRPERVFVDPDKDSVQNIVTGRVQELIYLGDHIRVRVALCGNDNFIVKIPNNSNSLKLQKDKQIVLGWSADDCRGLDA